MEPSGTGGGRASTRELREEVFRDAAAIVRAELGRPLTLTDVARRVAASPRQLRRAFAQAGGTTFRSYLRDARVGRAEELLEGTDMPVKEISRRVGYRDASQFTKAFKRARGVTPSGFRAARGPSPLPRPGLVPNGQLRKNASFAPDGTRTFAFTSAWRGNH